MSSCVKPKENLVSRRALEFELVTGIELGSEFLVGDGATKFISEGLRIIQSYTSGGSFILGFGLLGLVGHALELLLQQMSLFVSNEDTVGLIGGLVGGGNSCCQ